MYQGLIALAQHLSRPVLVFDLEATTLRGRENFGITEFAGLLTHPSGRQSWVSTLVNPENVIDPSVVSLTGITDAMVAREATWGVLLASLLDYWAEHAVVVGFNSKSFDCPAVSEQNARYGYYATRFKHTLDVKSLAKAIWGLSGKLAETALAFGHRPEGQLHRAAADVALTARTLDTMARQELERVAQSVAPLAFTEKVEAFVTAQMHARLEALGHAGKAWAELQTLADEADSPPKAVVLATAKPPRTSTNQRSGGASTKAERQALLLAALERNPEVSTVSELRALLAGAPEFDATNRDTLVDWTLAELIDVGRVSALRFSTPQLREWALKVVPLHTPAWHEEGRRLKPMLERLQAENPPLALDYITLRASLEHAQLVWPTKDTNRPI